MARPRTKEEYKALHKRITEELWNNGNLDAPDEHLHPKLKGRRQAQGFGPTELKRVVEGFRNAFPDLKVTIDKQIMEGDELVSFTTLSGTHKGDLPGLAASNNQVSLKGTCLTTFEDGQVAEETVLYDQADMAQQLGVSGAQLAGGNLFQQIASGRVG